MNTLVKEKLKKKTRDTKYPEIMGYYEKTKSINNRDIERRRDSGQSHREDF